MEGEHRNWNLLGLISKNDIISSCIWWGIEHIACAKLYKTSKRYFWTGCQNVVRRDFGSRVTFSSLCPLPSCQIPRLRQGRAGEKCQPLNHVRQVPFTAWSHSILVRIECNICMKDKLLGFPCGKALNAQDWEVCLRLSSINWLGLHTGKLDNVELLDSSPEGRSVYS